MNQNIETVIGKIVSQENIFINEPMKKHTTFRIGGPADILVKPENAEQLQALWEACRREGVPGIILGNGSNVLVADEGIRGVVILLLDNFSRITVEKDVVTAQAGALLSRIGGLALEHGLTGFEFACGIPGTLGGACIMNAGAYGGEMKDILLEVTAMDGEGRIRDYRPEEMEFGYRSSIFARKKLIVLSARMQLHEGDPEAVRERMRELTAKRREKQPLEFPSAGSTFKRPEGYYAGKLIMDAGLRGFSVGDAAISEKHCGFVINKGNATAAQVRELMRQVSDRVYEQFGVRLEPEVRFLGNRD